MAFVPNIYGPFCPTGELTVVASGTAIQLSSNWSPNYDPNAKVTSAAPQQYGLGLEDIIINSPPNNVGGLYLVSYNIQGAAGSKNNVNTILLYIPQGSLPVSLKHYLGGSRFNANSLAIDSDQSGDKCWATGIVGH